MSLTCSLGVMCIIVSLWGKFKKSKYRIFRAGKWNCYKEVKKNLKGLVDNCDILFGKEFVFQAFY